MPSEVFVINKHAKRHGPFETDEVQVESRPLLPFSDRMLSVVPYALVTRICRGHAFVKKENTADLQVWCQQAKRIPIAFIDIGIDMREPHFVDAIFAERPQFGEDALHKFCLGPFLLQSTLDSL